MIDNLKDIIELRKELLKVNVAEKTSAIGSKLAVLMLTMFTVILSVGFLGVALVNVLNIWLETSVWGFVIVGLLFALLSIFFFKSKSGNLRSILAFEIMKLIDEDDEIL